MAPVPQAIKGANKMNMQLVERLMRGNSDVCVKYREFVESGLTHEKAMQMIYGKKKDKSEKYKKAW